MSIVERVKDLENGRGIQYLLDTARVYFNNPVYMVDAYYNLIGASEGPMEIFSWSEIVTKGTYTLQMKEYMAQAGIFDMVADKEAPAYLEKKGYGGFGIMTGLVVNGEKAPIGRLVMYEYYSTFEEECLKAFEVLSEKISCEIRGYEYFDRLPETFFEETVNKLLDRSVKNTIVHHSQPRVIRHFFEKYLYVAVVEIPRHGILEDIHKNRLEFFRSLLKSKYRAHRAASYADSIVMMMSSEHGDYHDALPFGQDTSFFEYNGLFAGVSNSFEDIYEFDQYYDQAVAALNNGLESGSAERIFLYT